MVPESILNLSNQDQDQYIYYLQDENNQLMPKIKRPIYKVNMNDDNKRYITSFTDPATLFQGIR